jgi:hypothetical protein
VAAEKYMEIHDLDTFILFFQALQLGLSLFFNIKQKYCRYKQLKDIRKFLREAKNKYIWFLAYIYYHDFNNDFLNGKTNKIAIYVKNTINLFKNELEFCQQ